MMPSSLVCVHLRHLRMRLYFRPPRPVAARRHRSGDEAHPAHALGDSRHQQARRIGLSPGPMRADLIGQVAIELRERFEIALRVTGRESGRHGRPPASPRHRRGGSAAAARRTSRTAAHSAAPAPSPATPSRRRRAAAARSRCPPPPGSTTASPRAPPAKRSSIPALSSSARPATNVVRSAATCSTCRPVTNSARLKACVPMSPTQPAAPLRFGSVRHSACFCPVVSSRVVSQSCGYSTCTTRIAPSSPAAIISRACRTIG